MVKKNDFFFLNLFHMVLVVMLVYILFKVAQHFRKDMEGYFKEKVGQVFICDLIFFPKCVDKFKKKNLKNSQVCFTFNLLVFIQSTSIFFIVYNVSSLF